MKDLTQGNEAKVMLQFAFPLIVGNIFQQFYNIADTILVGKFVGSDALAAVGSSFSIVIFLTSIIIGLCMGASTLFAHFFGAKEISLLKKSIYNGFIFIALLTLILNVLVLSFSTPILQLVHTPESIFTATKTYLTIIFYGLGFTFLYNYFSCLLRALGNSFMPLIFLIVSSLLNIVLDLIFIIGFQMGVEGAALATIIAQAFSALLITFYSTKKLSFLHYTKQDFRLNIPLMKQLIHYSVFTSIQQSIMNFGILMIQGLVNTFGVSVMAAFAAAVKIDAFAYMPAQDFGNAFAIYIAQNKGARQTKRIHKGIKIALGISTLFCAIASLCVLLFATPLLTLFISKDALEILHYGKEYLWIVSTFYILIGYLFLSYGYYRGIGKANISVILTVISLGLRVALAYTFAPSLGVIAIWWAIPVGWFIADLTSLCFYIYFKKNHSNPINTKAC